MISGSDQIATQISKTSSIQAFTNGFEFSGTISGSSTSTGSFGVLNIGSRRIQGNDGLILPTVEILHKEVVMWSRFEIRFNIEQNTYEGYDGNNWGTLGGVIDVDQDTKISAENSAGSEVMIN